MFLSVGDILQLSRLAADLYTKGWAVARDAPQDFRDLVHELLLLKAILFGVHKKVKRDPDSYGDATERVLQRCFDALSEFSTLVRKYEKLALSDRGHWFRRLQWSREQDSIKDCHTKLQKYQSLLQLVLTPEGSEEQPDNGKYNEGITWPEPSSPGYDERYTYRERPASSFSQPTQSKTIDSSQTLISSYPSPPRIHDKSPILSQTRPNASYLEAGSAELALLQKTSSQITGRSSVSDSQRGSDSHKSDQFFTKRPSDASIEGRLRHMSFSTIGSEDPLTRLSAENTILQPLEIPEQREQHDCPKEIEEAFLRSFESIGDEVLDESWICIATWWLLKRKVAGEKLKRRPRKLANDLLKALKTDLHRRQRDRYRRSVPGTDVLLKQDLSLLESFEQIVEAKESAPQAMDDLTTSQRWITIDTDHAGFEEERVMFRCWVNAQIGRRNERSKSSNAPYVILLWTKAGESEIFVSLCNQRDTLNLSRKLTAEDVEDWDSLDGDSTALHLEFPSQPAEINFLAAWHFEKFREGPKQFFNAVRGRDPRSGELTIFHTVLNSYRNTNPSSPSERSNGDAQQGSFDACELRVYEQMDDMCWKTVRRLVVSSAADSKRLGSVSHWLPISNVRLQVEDRTVTISWSDFGHLEKKTQGNYNPYYSYVYRSDQPNQKIILVFRHNDDAQKFEDCILYLTETPPQARLGSSIKNPSAFQEIRLYSLFDQDDPDRGYHGIVHSKRSPKTYHCSQIGYVYRDLDFTFQDRDPTAIIVHNVRVPHYISTRHKMLARPTEREVVPQFREVTYMNRPLPLSFSCDEDAVKFLNGLTGWRLKFYRQSAKLVLTDTSRFRNPKKSHKGAEMYLWEKAAPEGGNLTQLTARLDEEDRPWLTARLETSGGGLGLPTGGVAELKGLAVQQGKDLDTKHMKANTGEEANSKSCWKLTIIFKETGDRDATLRRRSINTEAGPLPSNWDKLGDEAHKQKFTLGGRSTETQAENIFASSSELQGDAHGRPVGGHQATSKSIASTAASSSSDRENKSEISSGLEVEPQLTPVSAAQYKTIDGKAEGTETATQIRLKPTFRDIDYNPAYSVAEAMGKSLESSARSASLTGLSRDNTASTRASFEETYLDDQHKEPEIEMYRSEPLVENLNRNSMALEAGKKSDGGEAITSVATASQGRSHRPASMTSPSVTEDDKLPLKEKGGVVWKSSGQASSTANGKGVNRRIRKRLKTGCLSKSEWRDQTIQPNNTSQHVVVAGLSVVKSAQFAIIVPSRSVIAKAIHREWVSRIHWGRIALHRGI
ncbi:MAG: hypothetical protein Q9225_006097 [Loekoesia sp. 1 TL-2023]